MAAESNRRYQDLHTAAGNAVRMLSPHAPMGMTLADHLCTVLPCIVEVDTYCICLGAPLAMATAQLWLGEDLTVVEPRFLGETSYRQRQNLIGEFSAVGNGIQATVDVENIARNAPRK